MDLLNKVKTGNIAMHSITNTGYEIIAPMMSSCLKLLVIIQVSFNHASKLH